MVRLDDVAILGLLACAWLVPTAAEAAPKATSAAQHAPKATSAAQQAMNECALNYCGPRSPSVSQSKGILVESCFRQKTGHSPAEMGIAIPYLRCCPNTPCVEFR